MAPYAMFDGEEYIGVVDQKPVVDSITFVRITAEEAALLTDKAKNFAQERGRYILLELLSAQALVEEHER